MAVLNDNLGSFVDDAAADARVAARGWTLDTGIYYVNTTSGTLRVWDGAAWGDM